MPKAQSKRKAVFLDRDGVINREVHYLADARHLRLLPRAAQAIKELNGLGFAVIVITNQGQVAKGMLHATGVDEIHAVLIKRIEKGGARIDAIYHCPHHPEGTVAEYAITCDCRKPGIGMIMKAAEEHGIAMEGSYLVGDRTGDILAGQRAGLITILVETGYAGKDKAHDVKPDYIAKNLHAAVKIIQSHGA